MKIKEEGRNTFLYSQAKMLAIRSVKAKKDKTVFAKVVKSANIKHCNPPLPDCEVETIINSVWKRLTFV